MLIVDRAVYQRLRSHLSALYGQDELPRILSRIDLLTGRYGVDTCPDEPCGRARWDQRDAVLITYGEWCVAKGSRPCVPCCTSWRII